MIMDGNMSQMDQFLCGIEDYDHLKRCCEQLKRENESINKLYQLELDERIRLFASVIQCMTNGEWDRLKELRPDLHDFVKQAVNRKATK